MKVATKGDLFRRLKKSGLLTGPQRVKAREVCQGIAEAREAARRLTDVGMLTEWQATQLLRGRSRFFVGKYKLLKFRGRGAMGLVFKAEHPSMGRTVAIKVLPRLLLDKPRSVARFLREIRSTAVLNHPNLVVAYDADAVGKTYCIVMEYISGKSIKAICSAHGKLPVLWSCECARQAALGLQHICDKQLVHRDVKPSNLLAMAQTSSEAPRVKLLDVGLARFVSETEEDGALTRDGQIVGTGDFMAPEQVAKARDADIRADIYGLGATLYCMLTGTPPLLGKTLVQTFMNRMQKEVPPVASLRPDIPPQLDAILAKMLHRDLAMRYQTPAEVAADLADLIDRIDRGEALPARAAGTVSRIREDRWFSVDSEIELNALEGETSDAELTSVDTDASVIEFFDLVQTQADAPREPRGTKPAASSRWLPLMRGAEIARRAIVVGFMTLTRRQPKH